MKSYEILSQQYLYVLTVFFQPLGFHNRFFPNCDLIHVNVINLIERMIQIINEQ